SLAGRLYVDRQDLISILDITVLEDFRGRGIGRAIIEAILAEGKASGRTVRIYTEDFNPAFGLFTALGFEVTEKDGFLCRLDAAQRKKKQHQISFSLPKSLLISFSRNPYIRRYSSFI